MSINLPDKYKRELDFDVINENIDLNLSLISTYPISSFLKKDIIIKTSDKLPVDPKKSIIEFMKIEKLIDMPNEHMLNLTKLGYEIHRKGGWIKHLYFEKAKVYKEDKKNAYDFYYSRLRYWTFWPALILGAFGGIYSGYNLITKITDTKPEQKVSKVNSPKVNILKKADTINKAKIK